MALTAKDKADIAAMIATAFSTFAAPPQGKVVAVGAEAPVHVGPSGKPDGRRFPCTAPEPCGRLLRSAGRASVHATGAALATTGHQPGA